MGYLHELMNGPKENSWKSQNGLKWVWENLEYSKLEKW